MGGEDDPVALAGANEAEAALALVERAVARAHFAADAAVGKSGVVAAGMIQPETSARAKAP